MKLRAERQLHSRSSGAMRLNVACCAVLLFSLGAAGETAAQTPTPRADPVSQAPLPPDVALKAQAAILNLDSASDSEREAAAARIVADIANPAAIAMIRDLLTAEPPAQKSAAWFVLRALAAAPSLPAETLEAMKPALQRATSDEDLSLLLNAMAPIRTREAAALLVQHVRADRAKPVRDAAAASLARLSGRDDIGGDAAVWEAWLARSRALSDSAWAQSIADALAARAQRAEMDRLAAVSRLVETFRKMHLSTPDADRSAFLADLLLDDLAEVRSLGFELVARELSASHPLNGAVGDAAIKLLSHPDAAVRANAALLINQLSPASAEAALLQALRTEQDPAAAAAILDALSRFPSEGARTLVLRRLGLPDPTGRSAQGACLSLARAGLLGRADKHAVLDVMRSVSSDSLSPAGCQLLAILGDDSDLDALAVLLTSGSPSLRQAAAAALTPDARMTDAVLSAAADDADLYSHAARAILLHRPDAAGYLRLRSLTAPTPDAKRDGLLLVTPAIPATDVWALARRIDDPAEADELLASLIRPERVMSEGVVAEKSAAILAGGLRLARLRLDAQLADDCLAAIDAIRELLPPDTTADVRIELASMEAAALLLLDRAELVQSLNAPCSAWLDGLRRSIGKPHARPLADLIAQKFRGMMTLEESEQFAELRAKAGG